MACLCQSCKQTASPDRSSSSRGEPVLKWDKPVYDEKTKTYSLTLYADSTSEAEVTYFLLDGDSVIMQNKEGLFTGITPFDEGYNVQATVVWSDTTITTPLAHVLDFAEQQERVEKMSAEELQQLIAACDASLKQGKNPHLAQGVKLVVNGCHGQPPSMLPDVIILIENELWKSVSVTSLDYDENNRITSIALKPVGEQVAVEADDEEDEDYDY